MRYVIIGNSTAAVGAIEGIRSVDPTGAITLFSSEPEHTYSRPLISYMLCGKTTEEKMKYRPADFYEKNKVTPMLGVTVTAIDAQKKTVTADGKTYPYDRLLVATGSRPFVPPFEGMDSIKAKFTFMSLADARALQDVLFAEARVFIVGAGLIGLKCAEGIAGKVGQIIVADMADRVLPSVLDADGSKIVQDHLEAQGIQFYLSNSVKSFSENTAVLADGQTVGFDIVVFAVGVRPNSQLVKDAGGDVARGIVTDETCRTTLPDVWAAGDCAESYDISIDGHRVLALLPNAYMQGECAGVNMAGGEKTYDNALPMNALSLFGLHTITCGSYDGDEECITKDEGNYKRLIVRKNRLVGYILIGAVERAGIYTALIREQTDLDTIDFDLIKEKPQLMAFSKVDRLQKLGRRH
jgi:NAD(P)H-nitrite reductase large subunit